jgi:hypothetical protein
MRTSSMCGLLLLLGALISFSTAQAAWKTRKVDTHTDKNSTRLEADLAAYEKEGDIYLHRISSGVRTRITHDSFDTADLIIALEDETLWYWAHDRHTSIYDLHRYFVQSGRDDWLFSFDALIAEDQGTADAGRLVIWKDHEWCLLKDHSLERLTFSGEALCKQQAWLMGDYLVWRAVAGTPGVYATHLPTKKTTCIFEDDVPPSSLWASGIHAAWVRAPSQTGGEYTVFHHKLDTRETRVVGTSEEDAWGQVTLEHPYLLWIKKVGPSWLLMRTHLEDHTEESLYESALPMHGPRVSGKDVLLVTENCQGAYESCWELNVFNQEDGDFTQLTHFGTDHLIFAHRIDRGNIAFTRYATAFPFVHEVFAGFKTPDPLCGTLSRTGGLDAGVNLALVLAPLAIAPWLCRRRIRRGDEPHVIGDSHRFPQPETVNR